jgi:hypothetical protein
MLNNFLLAEGGILQWTSSSQNAAAESELRNHMEFFPMLKPSFIHPFFNFIDYFISFPESNVIFPILNS